MNVSIVVLLAFLGLSVARLVPQASYKYRNMYVQPNSTNSLENRPNVRIVGGEEAQQHSIPYQALLTLYSGINGWYCSGSLISSSVILTVAHCGVGANAAVVLLGAHRPKDNEDSQVVETSREIIIHSGYNENNISNDIALVILSNQVSINDNIGVVPLPPNNNDKFVGNTARTSGWGSTDGSSNALSDVLRYVDSRVTSNAECGMVFNTIRDTNICTSGENRPGACAGDSGDPVTVDGILVGMVSFGVEFCTPGYPTAATRVASYLEWIDDNAF